MLASLAPLTPAGISFAGAIVEDIIDTLRIDGQVKHTSRAFVFPESMDAWSA